MRYNVFVYAEHTLATHIIDTLDTLWVPMNTSFSEWYYLCIQGKPFFQKEEYIMKIEDNTL